MVICFQIINLEGGPCPKATESIEGEVVLEIKRGKKQIHLLIFTNRRERK
jgi:hypothetical protein